VLPDFASQIEKFPASPNYVLAKLNFFY